MIKVNLEKELIRQNKSLVSAKELLLIKEHDKLGDMGSNDHMRRVFGITPSVEGESLKKKVAALLNQTKNFDENRVFHISQIEKLCKKYHLRFLLAGFYRGSIDPQTSMKISQFEIAHEVNCIGGQYGGNTYIVAPAKSFRLEKRPKDPLLFYKINEQYFYLIHKWGNDLNIIRRTYNLLSRLDFSWAVVVLPCVFAWGEFVLPILNDPNDDRIWPFIITGFYLIGAVYFTVMQLIEKFFRIMPKNNWRSTYID